MTGQEAPFDLTRTVTELFNNQLRDWELARINYSGLQNTRIKTISFEGFNILVQFNPKRIQSSAAKVDPASIKARPCFLCEKNRPSEQKGIRFRDEYVLLVNPYPIFHYHLTIPTLKHELQRILPNFGMMLKIAKDLPGYTILYNGPQCGASAPDHFHFQAVPKHNMPIETDFTRKIRCRFNFEIQGIEVYTWNRYLRRIITLSGNHTSPLEYFFHMIYKQFAEILPPGDEPMLNILTWFSNDNYVVHLIPRKLHRPDRYFMAGERQLLLSPASIDLGGILIMPREEDFEKITRADIVDVFNQIGVDDDSIQYVVNKIT